MSHGSYAGVEQSTPTTVDGLQLRSSSSDLDVTDYVNTSKSDSNHQPNERAPLLPDDNDDDDLERTAPPPSRMDRVRRPLLHLRDL
jgi:hypothetical protein